MKKSLLVLAVLLMLLLVVGVVYAERRTCDKCNGTGIVCDKCGQSMPYLSSHNGCGGRGMTCYICDGKRYVEVDVCE